MSIGKKSSQLFGDLVEAKLRHFPGSIRLLSLLPRPPQCLKTKLLIASFFCFLSVTAASYSRKKYNSKREQNFWTLPLHAKIEFFHTTPSYSLCFWKCLIIIPYVVFNFDFQCNGIDTIDDIILDQLHRRRWLQLLLCSFIFIY